MQFWTKQLEEYIDSLLQTQPGKEAGDRAPMDDGAPIENYIIQMYDKEGRAWVDVATLPGNR
jgi:hypothetical protein